MRVTEENMRVAVFPSRISSHSSRKSPGWDEGVKNCVLLKIRQVHSSLLLQGEEFPLQTKPSVLTRVWMSVRIFSYKINKGE